MNQAETLKQKFDETADFVARRLGEILDLLETSAAAGSIGADVASVPGKNVQAILTALETRMADRYTKGETDAIVKTNTDSAFLSVAFDPSTGILTFTQKDGKTKSVNILTLIQYIPTEVLYDQRYHTKTFLDPILDNAVQKATDAKTAIDNLLIPMTELDDISICSGTARLTPGWTYVPFPRLFRATPAVTCSILDTLDATAIVKQVNESGFYAAIVKTNAAPALSTTTASGGSYSTFYLSGTSSWTNVQGPFSVVTGVSASAGATQFLAGTIHYSACLDNGVRLGG